MLLPFYFVQVFISIFLRCLRFRLCDWWSIWPMNMIYEDTSNLRWRQHCLQGKLSRFSLYSPFSSSIRKILNTIFFASDWLTHGKLAEHRVCFILSHSTTKPSSIYYFCGDTASAYKTDSVFHVHHKKICHKINLIVRTEIALRIMCVKLANTGESR